MIGFDTFEGLKGTSKLDGQSQHIAEGFYATGTDYVNSLEEILRYQEAMCPLSHMKKFEIYKGDVRQTLPTYLEKNPQTIIAFAYFDMDIYVPTKEALMRIKPYLTKGSILGFDEMNWREMPGPTIALREVFGDSINYRIERSPLQPVPGFIVIE